MNFGVVSWSACGLIGLAASCATAQDWPQWRGSDRNARVAGFQVPESWPQELTQQWKVTVGEGVATPALVGQALYVFARQGDNEVLRRLQADSGEEIWQASYPAEPVTGAAGDYSGPRASPTVAEGKVVTLGVQGTLSCVDAESGKLAWRNSEYEGSVPRFATSSSPIVVDGLCIAQLGSEEDGGIVAFDLASGDQRWKWSGDGPAYGSPVLSQVGATKVVIAPTSGNLVALGLNDGQPLWQMEYSQGRYNAASPIVEGQTLVYAGPTRGITAVKVVSSDDKLETEPLWRNEELSVQFNTPIVRDGRVYGLSNLNVLFCLNAQTGATIWTAPLGPAPEGGGPGGRGGPGGPGGPGRGADGPGGGQGPGAREGGADQQPSEPAAGQATGADQPQGLAQRGERGDGQGPQGDRGRGGRGGRGGRRGRGGGGGYGSLVDAGSVIIALTPSAELIVFEPGDTYRELAKYKVSQGQTHAYPVLAGKRIYIKDADSVTLWTVE
jgi:outer membrane protein assembly factor BamB